MTQDEVNAALDLLAKRFRYRRPLDSYEYGKIIEEVDRLQIILSKLFNGAISISFDDYKDELRIVIRLSADV